MEPDMVQTVRLADLEYSFPISDFSGCVSGFGENRAFECPSEKNRTIIHDELRPFRPEISQSKLNDFLVTGRVISLFERNFQTIEIGFEFIPEQRVVTQFEFEVVRHG